MPRFRSFLPKFSSRAEFLDVFLRGLSLVVLCSVVYRYCWIDYQDPFKCSALLRKGDWLDAKDEFGVQKNFKTWQPPGCMIHEYTKAEIRKCLGKKRMVIIGDSTARQIFWSIARKMDLPRAEREMSELLDAKNKFVDNEFVVDKAITLQYVWDPYLNSSTVKAELEAFRKSALHESPDDPAVDNAGFLLLGAPGLWHARKGGSNYFKGFKETMDSIIPYMNNGDSSQKAPSGDWNLPAMKDSSKDLIIMAPVRTPWYPLLSPGREETLTPARIDPLNEHLSQLSSWQGADIAWSFANMTWQHQYSYQESGFHVIRDVANAEAEILLNLRCNAALGDQGAYPHDGTCCMNYRSPDWRQKLVIYFAFLGALLLWINRRTHFLGQLRFVPSPDLLRPFSAFVLILCFCFLADRTQIFEKGHKSFVENDYLWACIITSVIGIVTMKKQNTPQREVHDGLQRGQEQHLLSRNQTDEWKGWMQALLLIYHYTSASEKLWGYEISQIIGAAYLFVTGYGHTIYFLTKDDYSLDRVAHVLIRLNLFVCTLAYMMRTDYTYYHFAPLASFWFGVVYYILRVKKSLNSDPLYLILKVVFSGFLITIALRTPYALNSIFSVLKFTFRMEWDIPQLQKLIYQDFLIVYLAMIFAIVFHRYSSLVRQASPTSSIIDKPLYLIRDRPVFFKASLTLLAMIIIPVYWIFTVQVHTKSADYDKFHGYLSFIPILCYIALRNCTTFLQTRHSSVFIWLGRHSLELYLLQPHIWLAADSRGILKLGIGSPTFQFVAITAVFLWVSAMLRNSVAHLVEWIISGRVVPVKRGVRLRVNGNEWNDGSDQLDRDTWELPGSLIPDGEGTPSKSHGFKIMGIWGDVRIRIVGLVVFAWALNVTYR